MNRRTVPAHYVKHNAVTRVPRTFVYLDAEANQASNGRAAVQTFRLACAAVDRRYHHRDGWADRESATFYTPADLWAWVDKHAHAKGRTVVVAHNLSYDMLITNVLRELPALGWQLRGIRLDRGQAWAHYRHGKRTIVLCDSMSWVPLGLAKLGELVGIPKLDLPAWDDTNKAWEARCQRDVEILAEVWRRLMAFVVDDDLGNWKPTGAGQAWAAYRHRFMAHKLFVHEDDDARLAERRAAWAGRCEVWRHGVSARGPYTEWDYTTAYAHVGATCGVPIRLVGENSRPTWQTWERLPKRFSRLVDVTVTTDVPTVPCRHEDRILWPVGTFHTTLWENEVQLAIEHGAEVRLHRLWWYKRAPALEGFCTWALDLLAQPVGAVDPIHLLAVKHWSRALVGRFGARWSTWERFGRSPHNDISLGWAQDVSAGEVFKLLQLGHELSRITDVRDAPDAVVSVMSWVMAECRVRLWRAMQTAGLDHVLYVDTDALITDPAGTEALRQANVEGLRVKGEWPRVELLGPRQIVVGAQLRAAGVPRGAQRVGEHTWEADAWSELGTSIAAGEGDRVRIVTRKMTLRGSDTRRRRLPNGLTAPHELDAELDAAG